MFRILFSAVLITCSSVVSTAQDTIRHYIDRHGEACDYSAFWWFLKETGGGDRPFEVFRRYDADWYDAGEERPDVSVRNGSFVLLNASGTVMRTATYADDKETGVSVTYYPSGQIADHEPFAAGKREGVATYYYRNGRLSSTETYAADSLIAFELYNEDGSRDSITLTPTEHAEYPGGLLAMKRFLADSTHYPQIAKELGLEGKCHLQFVVDSTGRVGNIKVMRGVPDCPECDAEAIRVLKIMPAWTPGRVHNRRVSSTFNLPIGFHLGGGVMEKRKFRLFGK